jgi:hypothetical protein
MSFIRMKGVRAKLDGFLHEPGPQTPGTDFNSLGCPFYERPNGAEIRAKDPFRPVIGVADIISYQAVFSAHVT